MNIIIPMAGEGRRFKEAGYANLKPFIEINHKPMIRWVLENINLYGDNYKYIFICNIGYCQKLDEILSNYFYHYPNSYKIIPIHNITEGAACTVLLSELYIDNEEELLIVNSDQLVLEKHNIIAKEEWCYSGLNHFRKMNADGGIFCFWNDNPKWSYCRISNGKINQTIEKEVVSNFATTGSGYWFKRGKDFVSAAKRMINKNDRSKGEFYVVPAYNYLISDDKVIIPYFINNLVGLGTPEDLEIFCKKEGFKVIK